MSLSWCLWTRRTRYLIFEHTEHLIRKEVVDPLGLDDRCLAAGQGADCQHSEPVQFGCICLDPALLAGHEPDQRKEEELSALVECKKLNWEGRSHRF